MSRAEEQADQTDIPFEVSETIDPNEVGDLTDVKRDDTMPAANDVLFIIREHEGAKVEVRKDKTENGGDGSTVLSKVLRIQAQVAPQGTDGSGAFAGKILFLDLPLVLKLDAMKVAHDRQVAAGKRPNKPFNEKWHKDSLVDFKEFALATGLATMKEDEQTGQPRWTMTGPIDDKLLAILNVGDTAFMANVSRRENVQMDRFENKLFKFRSPAPVEQKAE